MKQYIVDAFTDQVFHGNPAAVVLLDAWLSDELMTNIAKENNLSETAFTVNTGNAYHLRWFTPGGEIDLCGHATLATAYVISTFVEPEGVDLTFETLSGTLKVHRDGSWFELDFPAYELKRVPVTEAMRDAIGVMPLEAYLGRDLVLVVADETTVKQLKVNSENVMKLDGLLVNVTARGTTFDCVTRSFAPKLNIAEDPVCGSGHCHVIPYWVHRTGQTEFMALQASARGGILWCRMQGNRVLLRGQAVLFAESVLHI